MKIVIYTMLILMLFGCQTTFEERKVTYVAIYKKAVIIIKTVGSGATDIYLSKKVADGEISEEEKSQMIAIINATLKP